MSQHISVCEWISAFSFALACSCSRKVASSFCVAASNPLASILLSRSVVSSLVQGREKARTDENSSEGNRQIEEEKMQLGFALARNGAKASEQLQLTSQGQTHSHRHRQGQGSDLDERALNPRQTLFGASSRFGDAAIDADGEGGRAAEFARDFVAESGRGVSECVENYELGFGGGGRDAG